MKAMSIAAIVLGLLVFSWAGPRYASHLAATRPKTPDPSHGLVIERKYRGGSRIYISRNDMYIETSINILGIALFASGALALRRHTSKGEA
jgi:hypothetical protein